MTATELQRIACRLSNSGWCRHWLNYYSVEYPDMAIQVRNHEGKPEPICGMAELGFRELKDHLYVIQRTDDDGQPFKSNLF